ncbi:MAG TPA: PAS domain S-box protein [Actinomycetota bacterium]|nr:PAS domain S-box protein [Actinomycetota bacterium]
MSRGSQELDAARQAEWALVATRWFGVAYGLFQAWQATTLRPYPPPHVVVRGYALIGAVGLVNFLVMVLIRRAGLPRLRRVGVLAYAADLGFLTAITWNYTHDPQSTVWVVGYVLPLEGAVRYGLGGALVAVAVATLSEPLRELYLADRFPGHPFQLGSVTFRLGVELIIALVAGVLAENLRHEARRATERALAAEEASRRERAARREVDLFHTAVTALLAGVQEETPERHLQSMAEAIAASLGFEVCTIYVREGRALQVAGTHGPSVVGAYGPSVAGGRVALEVGQGVAGRAAACGCPLVVAGVEAGAPGAGLGAPAQAAIPLQVAGEVTGVLEVASWDRTGIPEDTVRTLVRLAGHIGTVVQNARLRQREHQVARELRLQAERLRKAEARYRTLVEQLPAVTYVAEVDRARRWHYVSPQVQTLLGFTPEEWTADPDRWLQCVHPEDRARALAERERALRSGRPLVTQYRLVSRDGRVVWVQDQALPLGEEGGHPLVHGVMFDITERRLAEEAVRESEARKSAILEAALDAVITVDHEGRILEFNPAAESLFGLAASRAIGSSVTDLLRPFPEAEAGVRTLDGLLALGAGPGGGRRVETTAVRASGEVLPVELTVTPIDLPGRALFTCFVRDITDRKQAEEERGRTMARVVQAAEEERRWLAAELHDGPIQRLTALGMRLEVARRALEREGADPTEVLRPLQNRLGMEVGNLRRMVAGLRPPALDERGLTAALTEHCQALGQGGFRCRVESDLEGRLDPELETVLYRVAQEALSNIVKHAQASAACLSLSTRNGCVVLEVRDDGTGFDPRQVSTAGHHFGLPIMRERVQMAGGTLDVRSAPGKGTVVRVELPLRGPTG